MPEGAASVAELAHRGSGSGQIASDLVEAVAEAGAGELEVTMPRGASFEFESATVDVDLTGVLGDIEIENATGSLYLKDVGGEIDIDNATGKVATTNSSNANPAVTCTGPKCRNVNRRMAKVPPPGGQSRWLISTSPTASTNVTTAAAAT